MERFKIIAWGECPFCVMAKALLISKGYEIEYVVLDHARSLLAETKEKYGMSTVPIIIKQRGQDEQLIGGYTDLVKYFGDNSEPDV